jgi:hypothetical protein
LSRPYAATYLNNAPNCDENPQIEKDIDELMDVLQAITKNEEIDAFTDAVDKMNTKRSPPLALWERGWGVRVRSFNKLYPLTPALEGEGGER